MEVVKAYQVGASLQMPKNKMNSTDLSIICT